eukprot:TRINITY_DN11878_c0_g1_i2.p1 TRINITY_DN11878_c0_g1~~TRINITY_DN11878_c0_g1_i2.p1  ORF type:complete len:383 (-),score=73.62 TRINITY_DN11878_c0_g1_i2:193-1341(-)
MDPKDGIVSTPEKWLEKNAQTLLYLPWFPGAMTNFRAVTPLPKLIAKGGQAFVVHAECSSHAAGVVLRIQLAPPDRALDNSHHITTVRRLKVACRAHQKELRHLLGCLGASHASHHAVSVELYENCVPLHKIEERFPVVWKMLKDPKHPKRVILIESMFKSILTSIVELQELGPEFSQNSPFANQEVFLQFCDLKLENLFLDVRKRTIRAGDYGALGMAPAGTSPKLASTLGSRDFCPPEFTQGFLSDKVDVYSAAKCCVMLFSYCEVGRGTPEGWESPQLIADYLKLNVDDRVVQLMARCTSVDVGKRFSVDEALTLLDDVNVDDFAEFLTKQIDDNPFDSSVFLPTLAEVQANAITESQFWAMTTAGTPPAWMKQHFLRD